MPQNPQSFIPPDLQPVPQLSRPPVETPDLVALKREIEQFDHGLHVIESPPPGGTGESTPAGPFPFDVTFTGGPDPKDATAQPGTINGLLPTNFNHVFSLAATGIYYLVLTATATDGQIGSAVLSMDASPPAGVPVVQGQPPTSFAYLLGVVVDCVWFRTIGPGSLAAAGMEVFRVSKTSPAPGTLPYDIYYTWNITAV